MDQYRGMTPFEILCHKLKTHYSNIPRIEKIFLITCLSYIIGYALLFLGYFIASDTISINFAIIIFSDSFANHYGKYHYNKLDKQ